MSRRARLLLPLLLLAPVPLAAQGFRSADSVMRRLWTEGMERSQVARLGQVLVDSIGPRLSGTPGFAAAVGWLERTYAGLGIPVRREQYGTWRSWSQGTVQMQLVQPRLQNLEVELLAWSPGTPGGRPVEGEVVVLPDVADSAAAARWLAGVRGKFVLLSAPEPTCRAPQELERYARPATVQALAAQRAEGRRLAAARVQALVPPSTPATDRQAVLFRLLDQAGVLGIGTLTWSNGWGVNKVFGATAERVPTLDLSCEDFGLLHRLASHGQGPRVRLAVEAQAPGPEVPMFNVIAELKGVEKPDEYVLLSAHLDSWHAATGATDNGTGTLTMLEAMRLLKAAYPNPKRTILAGHWGGEEQGTIGSLAFGEDHPEVLRGLQVAFNQDNGTWRVEVLEGQGFLGASASLAKWVAQLPAALTDSVKLQLPGPQANSGSDHTSFLCHGAPAFRLQSPYPEYRQYTWHTNRDTWDKVVIDDLKHNATMAAMLAYAASEDPERTPRTQAVLEVTPGVARPWPRCSTARRRAAGPAPAR